ncbi:MAG: hypothetical protein ACFFA7_18705, partial [Promethearchaeota archaeon]
MINRKKQKYSIIIITVLMISLLGVTLCNNFYDLNDQIKFGNGYDNKLLKMASLYEDLIIDDNGAQDWDWAKSSGICTGFGTPASPYRILDGIFEYLLNPDGHCLQIFNSRKYFILRNCTFRDADMT